MAFAIRKSRLASGAECRPKPAVAWRGVRQRRGLVRDRASAGCHSRPLKDGLDVVAVGVDDEGREVLPGVLGPQTRPAVVNPTVFDCSGVPASYRVCVRGAERNVRPGCHAVSTRLAADRVQAEVVARVATEQDVGVALELALAQHRETEFGQGGLVHSSARTEVAHPEADVVDDGAHRLFRRVVGRGG